MDDLAKSFASDDSDVRADAATAAGNATSSPALIAALVDALADAVELVRANAAEALGRLHATTAIDELEHLAGDHSALVRACVAESLGELALARSLPVLLNLLDDADATVRGFAANSLGLIGDHSAVAALLRHLLHEKTDATRAEILGALYRLGARAHLAALLALGDNADVRINVVNVIEDLVDRSSLHGEDRDSVKRALARWQGDPLVAGALERLRARV